MKIEICWKAQGPLKIENCWEAPRPLKIENCWEAPGPLKIEQWRLLRGTWAFEYWKLLGSNWSFKIHYWKYKIAEKHLDFWKFKVKYWKSKIKNWKLLRGTRPGPFEPPWSNRPSRKMTARSYSCTTWGWWGYIYTWYLSIFGRHCAVRPVKKAPKSA